MKIERATLTNWKCFRGEHSLELGPGAHAIVAEYEHDPKRSNWAGKSSTLIALGAFPLFGEHGERTEDDWITRGENEGGVELVLSGGLVVKRWRVRGASTKFTVEQQGKTTKVEGKGAQEFLERTLALSWEDFRSWSYIEQKQMSRFIDATPGKRQEVVTEWLQLGPLERAGKRAQKSLASKLLSLDAAKTKAAMHRQRRRELIERRLNDHVSVGVSVAQLTDLEVETSYRMQAEPKRGRAVQHRQMVEHLRASEAERRVYEERRKAYERAHAEWSARRKASDEAAAELVVMTEQLQQDAKAKGLTHAAVSLAGAKTGLDNARTEVRRLQVLERGEFDGHCPVSPGFECPATTTIKARRTEAGAALVIAQSKELDAKKAYDEKVAEARAAEHEEAMRRARALKADRCKQLRDQPLGPEPQPPEGIASDVVYATDIARHEQAAQLEEREATELELELNQVQSLTKAIETAEIEVQEAQAEVDVWRAASAILGRQGAQRRIAEGGLLRIEAGANDSLAEAGVQLRVSTSWARPTNQPADQCSSCGWAYPKSTKVKRCERCGEERGPKLDERLDLELSNVSGAAEDLAGWAYQLSAGAFMRRRRVSPWSVAFLDEPFGSLDTTHSRALAQYLAVALEKRHALSQVFVVAHSKSVLDALPNRIEIVSDGVTSRVRVAA